MELTVDELMLIRLQEGIWVHPILQGVSPLRSGAETIMVYFRMFVGQFEEVFEEMLAPHKQAEEQFEGTDWF